MRLPVLLSSSTRGCYFKKNARFKRAENHIHACNIWNWTDLSPHHWNNPDGLFLNEYQFNPETPASFLGRSGDGYGGHNPRVRVGLKWQCFTEDIYKRIAL